MLLIATFPVVKPESHLKKILKHFNFLPNIYCFLNRKTLCLSLTSRKKMQFIFFFPFQISKSNTWGKFLSLSACRNRLSSCKWAPCYYMHLFCLLTQRPRDACFCKVCLSSLMGPSHISDTDYLMSQPISWLISRRMWNCLTSLQMGMASHWLNHTWCLPVSSVPEQQLHLLFLRQIEFLEPWLC